MIRLDIDRAYISTLFDITLEDMKMLGDVTEKNWMGQRPSTLAWFWRLGSDSAMDEVEKNVRSIVTGSITYGPRNLCASFF